MVPELLLETLEVGTFKSGLILPNFAIMVSMIQPLYSLHLSVLQKKKKKKQLKEEGLGLAHSLILFIMVAGV